MPSQGPIGVFIHHNTLHAFEHLPFDEAVVAAGRLYDANPFMAEEVYRAHYRTGRILDEDLDAVLEATAPEGAWLSGRITGKALRRRLMLSGLVDAEGDAVPFLLDDMSDGSKLAEERRRLFGEVRARLERLVEGEAPSRRDVVAAPPTRPRDLILEATGVDLDEIVHPVLIAATAAFLDQGVAYWPMSDRDAGLLGAVARVVVGGPPLPHRLVGALRRALVPWMEAFEADDPDRHARTAEAILVEELSRLGVDDEALVALLVAEALVLPGWAGMMRELERQPTLAPQRCPPCRLVDFLALRLLLVRLAAEDACARHGEGASLTSWLDALRRAHARSASSPDPVGRAYRLLQVLTAAEVAASEVAALPDAALRTFEDEVLAFGAVERRRLWHLAYERRHRRSVLTALATHRVRVEVERERLPVPRAQVLFCLDEREESLRRHLEEVAPDVETLGAAGFFGVAVSYQGIDDGRATARCPVVQTPQHEVREIAAPEHAAAHARYSARRLWLAQLRHGGFFGSRSLVRGAVATALLGVIAAAPSVLRLLSPGTAQRVQEALRRLVLPRPATRLALSGFTDEEMADRVGRVLVDAGLVGRLARVVAVVGHGSSSLNNPHASAYDCGACGGRPGGPNARAFAAMANRGAVRRLLAERGIEILDDTWFLGGYHDTSSDEVHWFERDAVPASHQGAVEALMASVDEARTRNAHERCRRFLSAPLTLTPSGALAHVAARAQDLAQPRVECGHATNAVCVVGRRGITRGLFLDRRAFLCSYDPSIDDDGAVLRRTLQAVLPVVAGINLEYYFSFVDNERYGCGTKLPHNVTGLIGVMNGAESDLRTGLPWQMVEIHEPVRLLMVIEAGRSALEHVWRAEPGVAALAIRGWIAFALVDPHTGAVHQVEPSPDGFRLAPVPTAPLPTAPDSARWYRGHREHLPIAELASGLGPYRADVQSAP